MKTSNYSTVLTVTTDPLNLDTPILDVMGAITYNSSVINWLPVDNAEGYRIYLENTDDTLVILDDLDVSNVLTYNLTGLYQNTNYQYKVKAYYNLLESSYSVADDFVTNDFVILPPTIGANTDLTFDSIRINWTKRSNATSYKIYLENTDDTLVILNGVDIGDVDTYLFDSLDSSTNYLWKIKSYNSDVNENSSYSSNQTFITNDPIPDTPTMSSSTSVTYNSFVANWSSEIYADSYNVYVYTDIALTSLFVSYTGVLTNSKSVTGLDPVTDYYTVVESVNESGVSAKSAYILTTTEINNLQIDSNTLIALDLTEGSGSSLSSRSPATLTATINGTTTSIWQSSSISDYSLDLNGTDNYIYTTANNTALTDFTFRIPFRFNTGDKTAKTMHILGSKYNTSGSNISGFIILLEFYSATNEIILTVNDSSGTWGSFTYRQYTSIYNFLEDQDYIIQCAFDLIDPSNSNLNTVEICVNGVKLSGTWTNGGISNINTIQNSNIPYIFGSYIDALGTAMLSQYKLNKAYFDICFRSESFALTDAQNIGLA